MALYVALIFVLVAADQVTKFVVSLNGGVDMPLLGRYVAFQYCQNTGAAFSSLEGKRILLIIVTAVLVAVCIYFLFSKTVASPLGKIGLAMIVAGGASNLYDRIFKGYVVDFIYVRHFAIFNVADSCVSIGAALMCIYIILHEKRQKTEHLAV
ncbi:MAG: signal peptidase II [Clostridia bacterium]|nr:signal peptidase II [Clostridia bacterium]MDR3644137.1 signal peptidase II [Clostridia bacterium]